MVDHGRPWSTMVDHGSTMVDHGRPWVDHGRPWFDMYLPPSAPCLRPQFFFITWAIAPPSSWSARQTSCANHAPVDHGTMVCVWTQQTSEIDLQASYKPENLCTWSKICQRIRFWCQNSSISSKIDRKWRKTCFRNQKFLSNNFFLASKNRKLQIVWNAFYRSFALIGAMLEG